MVNVDGHEVAEGLYYSTDYMWMRVEDGNARIGITDYAQRQMREIVFVELPAVGDELQVNDPFGTVESVKSVSDLVAPVSGTVKDVNDEVTSKPELLNEDPYGEGWLLVISPTNLKRELKDLMDFDKAVKWHKKLVEEG